MFIVRVFSQRLPPSVFKQKSRQPKSTLLIPQLKLFDKDTVQYGVVNENLRMEIIKISSNLQH